MAQKRTVGANILQSFKLFLSRIQTRILNTINQKGRLRYHIFDNILHPMTIQSDVADMARAGATTGHYQKNWRVFLYKLGRNFLKRFEYVCVCCNNEIVLQDVNSQFTMLYQTSIRS